MKGHGDALRHVDLSGRHEIVRGMEGAIRPRVAGRPLAILAHHLDFVAGGRRFGSGSRARDIADSAPDQPAEKEEPARRERARSEARCFRQARAGQVKEAMFQWNGWEFVVCPCLNGDLTFPVP